MWKQVYAKLSAAEKSGYDSWKATSGLTDDLELYNAWVTNGGQAIDGQTTNFKATVLTGLTEEEKTKWEADKKAADEKKAE